MRHLVRVADLSSTDADEILALAREARADPRRADLGIVVSLVFLAPSTRTRLGFMVAAARLGGHAPLLTDLRHTGVGLPPESLFDTVRVASGMSDVVVCRPGATGLGDLVTAARCPLVNGGDAREHPTQALIDRFAIETLAGPLADLHVGISGDLRSRPARSLVQLLGLSPPGRLSLFAPPGREHAAQDLPRALIERTTIHPEPDFADLDVLLLPGLAPSRERVPLAEDAHLRWGLSPKSAARLPASAVVLSPGPVIDEIDPSCLADPRVRVFEESDLGVAVRIGLLRWLVAQGSTP